MRPGRRHPPGDAAALAQCMARLATDYRLRKDLSARGRSLAEKHSDRSRLANDLPPIYERAARGRK
jgi:glycosyltransferase involved in cell wall biosynthesis